MGDRRVIANRVSSPYNAENKTTVNEVPQMKTPHIHKIAGLQEVGHR
jgi:hypothetical protein